MDFIKLERMHLRRFFVTWIALNRFFSVFADSYFMATGPVAGGQVSQDVASNTTQLLDQLLRGYDSRLRPGFGGPPTVVDVNLNVRSMGPISEQEMAYQMDCYFRQSWVDKRLEFSGPIKTLSVSVKILEKLWKPDTHFFNGQRSYLHTVTTPNKLLRIYQDGRILYSMRLTVKASCPMHLEKFPMDTQTCPLRFGSHGYVDSDVHYIWTHGLLKSIKMAADMRLSQFDLIGFPAGNCSYADTRGRFSELFVSFKLKRHMGYFMINVYVPCSLLVIISFVGFWINREATADRISLGTTTVLTMTFLGIDNRNDLPKVSYATALDIFVAVSFVFVLATVIQFALVHFFTKYGTGEQYLDESTDTEGEEMETTNNELHRFRDRYCSDDSKKMCIVREGVNGETSVMLTSNSAYNKKSRHKHKDPAPPKQNLCCQFFSCIIGEATYHHNEKKEKKYKGLSNSVSKIDKASRVIFPFLFLVFNIFYWTLYLDGDVTAVQFT